MEIRKVSENPNANPPTITLGFDPVPGAAGYVLYADGVRKSNTWDPNKSRWKVDAGAKQYVVQALGLLTAGSYPGQQVVGLVAKAWRMVNRLHQTDRKSGKGNKYTFAWVKSKRPSPTQPTKWANEGVLEFSQYPEEFVMIEGKVFEEGAPGRTTNFHLVGGDEVHDGVSPLSLDRHQLDGRLEIVSQAEGDGTNRPYHWGVASAAEIAQFRGKVWTFIWRIRWSSKRTGYVHLEVLHDGVHWKDVNVDGINTCYSDQQPRVYVWLGQYESVGSPGGTILQTLDYRGRTLEEAMRDVPVFGSIAHSYSTDGGQDSSATAAGTLTIGASS